MKYLPILGSLVVVVGGFVSAVPSARAGLLHHEQSGFFFSSPGYLGVDLREISANRASQLQLKDNHGAEIVLVDQDAPAGKSGLKVHDVVLALDGQPVKSSDQLRKRLHAMPPGQTISLLISRDGNPLTISVKLCDQAVLKEQAWKEHVPEPPQVSESFIKTPSAGGSSFLGNVIPRSLNVGAEVSPVRPQLADYFGVTSGTGLLVENVDPQSPASRAGLKAGDVIIRVEAQRMASRNEWLKAIRNHHGEPVQITIMRNKQEMGLTMNTGKPRVQ
jgi:serine protease Do